MGELFRGLHIMVFIIQISSKDRAFCIKKSDGLLTPTQFALEAYFPKQKDWHKHTKIYELPSGARRLEPVKSREDVRASWSSEPQTLFVGFFGRRHSHKGYDIYLEVASLIYKQGYRNIKFVTAGSGPQSDLKVPPNFIDLGYAGSELADYVNAVDVVIVPNRFSYFDLIILEAMSLGKKIIMSNAGGNKSFLGEPVIVTNIDAGKIAEAIIDLIVNDTLLIDESKVRGLYNSKYSLKSFAARHIRLAKEL